MLTEALGPVIVGVASPASLPAVDLAAEEAAARVAPLLILHASRRNASAQPLGPSAAELLAVAVARAQSEHPGLAAAGESVAGSASQVLLERAPTSCLVVLGDGDQGLRDTGTASIAVQVARQGCVPVIVHRPLVRSEVEGPRPVLVGVSADVDLDAVVGFAFEEAWLRGAPVHAMYVRPEHTTRADDAGAGRMLAETVTTWSEKYPDLAVHRRVRYGADVAVALAAASRSAQLVVVGVGSGPAARFRSWVAEALVYRAGCAVGVIGPC